MHLRSAWSLRRIDTEHFDSEPSPVATSSDERIELERALDALPATARAVVWLHDVEGFTHREIATLMGRTASFSKSQLARAHERLRTLLDCPRDAGGEPQHEPEGELPCNPALKTC
jgi:RNA polymerase sigma-70 factor (ECF subfamily)